MSTEVSSPLRPHQNAGVLGSDASDLAAEPWNRYRGDGYPLRPAPPRVRPTASWNETRRRLFSDHFEVLDYPRETPLTRMAADQLWEGDRFMDPVAEWFASKGPRARAMIEQALEHGIDAVQDPPRELVNLFEHLDRVPDWVDWEMFERGRQLAADTSTPSSGAQIILDGLISALGEEVSWAGGSTGRVLRDPVRRNLETIDWLYQITVPGAFHRFGKGFKDTVRVRLMHSLVRRGLIKKWGPEFLAHHGNPISSSHMAFGASTFGLSMLLFDMKAGRRYSRDDLDAVALYWGYVVYVFGANEAVIPKTADENLRFGDYMLTTMGAPTEWTPQIVQISLFGGILNPILNHDNKVLRSVARRALFPLVIGYTQHLVGPGLVHDVLQYSDYDRDYSGWEMVGRVFAYLAVLKKRIVDRLPRHAARRAARTQLGDPIYRPLVKALTRQAESVGTKHSGYTHHDHASSASGAAFASKAG